MIHSPLGASGASRWMSCPASVKLSQGIIDPESDHAALGTAAHALAAHCLTHGEDAWQWIGNYIAGNGTFYTAELHGFALTGGILVDKDMVDAVQEYLDAVRTIHPDRNQGNTWVERYFKCPTIHPKCWGASDFVHLLRKERTLHVWDYKHGAGIVVEVEGNVQGMYYACGVLEDLNAWDDVDTVVIHIAQPRGFHGDGPIRAWEVSTDDLLKWMLETLIPAMNRAESSDELKSGENCRFCPARGHACPQILSDLSELETFIMRLNDAGGAGELTNAELGRFLELFAIAKIAHTAQHEIAFNRLVSGKEIPGQKLANARANRAWKDGAEVAVEAKFGKDAWTKPKLKSPAQIEALPEGKAIASRYAFKPDAGLTMVPVKDARSEVSRSTKSMFEAETAKRKK